MVDPPDKDGKKEAESFMNMMKFYNEQTKDMKTGFDIQFNETDQIEDDESKPLAELIPDMFPCIFMVLGSAFAFMKVYIQILLHCKYN